MENEKDFFKSQSYSSAVKAKIVSDYFPQYCRIIMKKNPQKEIRFLDLFAGPGKYEDGKDSTPLLLGESCAKDPELRSRVRFLFNDKDFCDILKDNFSTRFPEGTFAHGPRFANKVVGEDEQIERHLSMEYGPRNPHPTVLFFDPWGYKGVNTRILAKFMQGWGNELFLFVNIKRIHAAIENKKFDDLMLSLFPTTIESIKKNRLYKGTVRERLTLIMDNLAEEFKKLIPGGIYHCAFKFQEEDNSGTSHFIFHLTKHPRGYELIKQVYYEYDNIGASLEKDNSYTFDAKKLGEDSQSLLLNHDVNTETLADKIYEQYKGKQIEASRLFLQHNTATKYSATHYTLALRHLFTQEKLESNFTDDREHRVPVLISKHCILKFK